MPSNTQKSLLFETIHNIWIKRNWPKKPLCIKASLYSYPNRTIMMIMIWILFLRTNKTWFILDAPCKDSFAVENICKEFYLSVMHKNTLMTLNFVYFFGKNNETYPNESYANNFESPYICVYQNMCVYVQVSVCNLCEYVKHLVFGKTFFLILCPRKKTQPSFASSRFACIKNTKSKYISSHKTSIHPKTNAFTWQQSRCAHTFTHTDTHMHHATIALC